MKNIATYIIRSNYSAEPSYAICTAYKNDDAVFQGESFLLFHVEETQPELVANLLVVEQQAEAESPVKIDKQFFLAEALYQAQAEYRRQVSRIPSPQSSRPWWPLQQAISEIALKELLTICRRHPGLIAPLQRIRALTQHHKLAAFLQKLPVHPGTLRITPLTAATTTALVSTCP